MNDKERIDSLFKKDESDKWAYVRNEIIDRISELEIDCPECENTRYDDDQYECGTCGTTSSKIRVMAWIKYQLGIKPH